MPAFSVSNVALAADLPWCAGVDVGGSKIALQLAHASGLQRKWQIATPKQGDAYALAQAIVALLGQACAAAGIVPAQLARIGLATAGPLVLADGALATACPNICGGLNPAPAHLPNDWTAAPLEAPLRTLTPDVRIALDTLAALAAERRWGALQTTPDCAYITWSTGIGAALCVNGQLLHGKNGNAGHLGHTLVPSSVRATCGCGNVSDIEALAGGHNLSLRAQDAGYADTPTLFNAARRGESAARALVDTAAQALGLGIYNLVVLGDLQRVALGGSIFWHHQDWLLPLLQAEVSSRFAPLTQGVELVPAGLGQQVGDYAALALCL